MTSFEMLKQPVSKTGDLTRYRDIRFRQAILSPQAIGDSLSGHERRCKGAASLFLLGAVCFFHILSYRRPEIRPVPMGS